MGVQHLLWLTATMLLFVVPITVNTQTREEVGLWQTVQNSTNADDIRAYLDKYPEGTFAPLAKRRLDALLEAQRASVAGSNWTGRAHFTGRWMAMMKAASPTDPKGKSVDLRLNFSKDGTCVVHGSRPCSWKQVGDAVTVTVPKAKGQGNGCEEELTLRLEDQGSLLSGGLATTNTYSFSCDGGKATLVLSRSS